jgi:signal transduction histidine kinase
MRAAPADGTDAVNWTLLAIAWMAAWAAGLAWFVVLVVRRARARQLRSLPRWQRVGDLVIDGIALPVLLLNGGLSGAWVPLLAVGIALGLWTRAPRWIASLVIPATLVGIGFNGFILLRGYARGWLSPVSYGLAGAGTYGSPYGKLLVPQACAFVVAGLWLGWRRLDRRSWLYQRVLHVARPIAGEPSLPRWGLLLLPLVAVLVDLLGRTFWLDIPWWSAGLTLMIAVAALVLVVRVPAFAADLSIAGMILLGLYGVALAAWWPTHVPLPSPYTTDARYLAVVVDSRATALLAGAQGLALIGFGLWLVPRAIDDRTRLLLRSAADLDLTARVARLTRTRADAVDAATAQLRRLERDLHDGAQARLVALGMSLRAAERMIPVSPDAAAALVAEARETSLKALDELRGLVRGICPPVLADRGLADAVRALALDTPLRTDVDVDLDGRPDQPIETACYFAVAEILANAVKHAAARTVTIRIEHRDGTLKITVVDDGVGGADPRLGSGLAGLERRLGTFDGVLAVSSPLGGPTIVAIEVPCALSSQRISTC